MRTRTELTRLEVTLRDGRAVVRSAGGVLRVATLSSRGPAVRVALVPERALLLAGDDVELDLVVDDGVHLHLVETAGTVAYAMRGDEASWRVRIAVGDGASLVHEALPWVSAEGSRVDRSLDLDLAGSGLALLRETLVLGRHGRWIPLEVRMWALVYPLYLFAVVRPITSMWRFLLLDFPIAALLASVVMRTSTGGRVVPHWRRRAVVVLGVLVIGVLTWSCALLPYVPWHVTPP